MGVKSLWQLLTPVGRPILLETLEGKSLAIDSSIWIYQFQATMRDGDGKLFVNAHVLGFLRRICKLLFYGIKPVFVFDGGAPTLKRFTINERKKKKSGAAAAHVKVAERLLAAQMRREAVDQAQGRSNSGASKGKGKAPQMPAVINEDTIYLEDLDNSVPKSPPKSKDSGSPSKKKQRFHNHDPYHLPEVDLDQVLAKAAQSSASDPRVATEEEMREFIEEMRPEDFDVNSPEFRELPTEIQYEIIGDLRLKSRQTSYKRLQNMLKNAPTPLDFSKEQIKNLQQRNKLTQQLLITTDSIGKAHVQIPIRIASERNREYVLIKNEGDDGGWVLGMRDEGTQAKPIVLDADAPSVKSSEVADSDDDMEEVQIPVTVPADPHLREYQREMALPALVGRMNRSAKPALNRTPKQQPLFDLDEDDELHQQDNSRDDLQEEDPALSLAIQESLEHKETAELQQALQASIQHVSPIPLRRIFGSKVQPTSDDDDDMYASPGRLATALSIGNTGSTTLRIPSASRAATVFGKPTLLLSNPPEPSQSISVSDDDMEEVQIISVKQTVNTAGTSIIPTYTSPTPARESSLEYVEDPTVENTVPETLLQQTTSLSSRAESESDLEMEEIVIPESPVQEVPQSPVVNKPQHSPSPQIPVLLTAAKPTASVPKEQPAAGPSVLEQESEDDEPLTDWSRSPSPQLETVTEPGTFKPPAETGETWDAAHEMDPEAEQGEFARFMSQMKGRDLDDVRKEIDEEIKDLRQQKKVAMRDSDDITQQMISQIMVMLRLFGIPYITAPMEAEAQCAELVSLGLVDGIITDDSDVFLFGGHRVFKHMFNQSKTVECFLASDLTRELGLDRDTLIRLAYLLGSDYVDGLPGVGPVVAMELLKEFPGNDGLHKFRDWWLKVQTGKDRPEDNKSKFRKRFKKKFKDLYLSTEWPNPAVRDAYYHPTIDDSDEPFKWGLPDLDGLRGLLREELSWSQQKSDDLLLPVVQRVGKRRQAAALNKQGNLDGFFDINSSANGTGSYAPRKRQAYASKRLQQVVTDYRNEQKKRSTGGSVDDEDDEERDDALPSKKRKTDSGSKATSAKRATAGSKRGRGRGRGRGRSTTEKRKKNATETDGDDSFGETLEPTTESVPKQLRPRPKPRPTRKTLLEDQHESSL